MEEGAVVFYHPGSFKAIRLISRKVPFSLFLPFSGIEKIKPESSNAAEGPEHLFLGRLVSHLPMR